MINRGYIRLKKIPVKYILWHLERGVTEAKVGKNIWVKLTSIRLQTYTKGIVCVNSECGIEGSYFAVEKQRGNNWHLNLYHLTGGGEEIMMTSDHILAKARGGSDTSLSNRQCLCEICNTRKGHYNSIAEADQAKAAAVAERKDKKEAEKLAKKLAERLALELNNRAA